MSLRTLILKDLKIVLSDRKAFVLLVAMPIILFSILSFALAGSFQDDERGVWDIEIGVVKQYDFNQDYELVKAYTTREDAVALENILFSILDDVDLSFVKYKVMTYDEALLKIENDELASVIVLPPHYLSNLMMNMSPTIRMPIEIEVIRNVDKSYSSDIIENLVSEMTRQLSQMMITNKVAQESLSYFDVPNEVISVVLEAMKDMGNEKTPLEINVKDFKIDKLKTVNSAQYYSVAMMAMFLLFGASYGAKFMLVEKKKFTLQRQMMAGLKPRKIVVGKMFLIFSIAVLQISIMILTSVIGFHVYWGNPLHVILLTLLTAFSITGFGSILAAMALKMDSVKALNMFESGIFQVIALFGGSYFPIFLMPGWFQLISKMLVNGAALDAYHKVMMGADWQLMMPSLVSLMFSGIVFLTIGIVIINTHADKGTKQDSEEVVI